jgi:two-component system LytT family sensor kinase
MDPKRLRQIARAYLTSIAVWSALSLLTGWQYSVSDRLLNGHTPLLDMLFLGEVRGFTFALLTPPIFYIVRRYGLSGKHPIRSLSVYLLGAVPFVVCYVSIRWLLFPSWDLQLQRFVPRSAASLIGLAHDGAAEELTTYIGILAAAHAYGYFTKLRRQELDKYEFAQALAASELQVLRMQLHPHFLFNTLNGIGALIDGEPATSKAMIVKLSHLLRTALDHGSSDLIPLREELKFAREYLDLEKMRLGSRLRVEWSVDAATQPLLVPQMILQPLVENAIRHGIAGSRAPGWVEVASRRSARGLELSIRNSVGGKSPGGTGLGLRNTEARLRCLYAEDARFSFVVSESQTAAATLLLPALPSEGQALGLSRPPDAESIKSEKVDNARIDRG